MMKSGVFPWRQRSLALCLGSFLLCHAAVAAPDTAATASPAPAKAAASPGAGPSPGPSPTPAAAVAGVSLNDIASKGQDALGTLKTFGTDTAADQRVAAIRDALPALTKSIADLHERTARATADGSTPIDTLHALDAGWQKLIDALVDHSTELGNRGRALEAEAANLKGIDALWRATRKSAEAPTGTPPAATPPATSTRAVATPAGSPGPSPAESPAPGEASVPRETLALVQEVIEATAAAQKRVQVSQTNILDLQNLVGALLAQANAGQDTVDDATNRMVKALLVRDSPPLWSAEARPRPDLPGRWRAAWAEQTGQVRDYVGEHDGVFGLHLLVFLVLIVVFLYLRWLIHRWTEDEPHLKRAAPIFDVPVAGALAISFLVVGNQYAAAPGLLRAALAVGALLPTVLILRRVLARRFYVMLYALVAFTVIDQVLAATQAFPAVNRWLFCAEMLAAGGIFLWLLRAQRTGPQGGRLALGRWMSFLCGLAALVFAAALLATALGYFRLGVLLGGATLSSSYSAVFLYAALRVLDGLIVIALRVRPVSASRIAQTHRDQVQTQVYNVFRALAVILWLKYSLEQLQVAKPLLGWAKYQLTREIPLGRAHSFSLDQLLWFGLAIWLSLLVSRVLRFFLNEEVYERVQLAPGLPYAISTMLNYVVLLVGFGIAIGLLGIPLTQISIVAGAFSVGLGFGLQNIINNFVSGIILLFERPVKVGDVIQFGDATGEVRRIGIRASIIRTREGSDIILPNGNLISSQVTNWTYADRSRAVELTLTVAASAEPGHVIEVLRKAADREPATQDRPAPEVYVTGLSATGYTVVVRAWTNRYENWIEVRSELNVTIHGVLARENIQLV